MATPPASAQPSLRLFQGASSALPAELQTEVGRGLELALAAGDPELALAAAEHRNTGALAPGGVVGAGTTSVTNGSGGGAAGISGEGPVGGGPGGVLGEAAGAAGKSAAPIGGGAPC